MRTFDMESKDLQFVKCQRDEHLLFHYMMLTRQMTKLADCFTHIIRVSSQISGKHGSAQLDYKGWVAYSQSEISDLLAQTKKLCDILGIDFVETYIMGMKRDAEKREEYLKTHPGDEWI
jgi:hypothetical protein